MPRSWMGFSAVDASDDPAAHAAYLARMAEWVGPLRQQALKPLGIGPGTTLLDAGCGIGELVIELAPTVAPGGRVVGVDASREMIRRAEDARAAAGVDAEFVVASITDLPFPPASFDVCRSERVFQHLDDGQRSAAASELLRVTRPGGLIQLIDPDHRQHAVAATDRELAWRITEMVATRGRSPESGLLNSRLLLAAGAVDVRADVIPIRWPGIEMWFAALALEGWLDERIADGTITAERRNAFFTDLERRERDGVFLATGVTYIVTGRAPG